ncbi:MAG: hypothetical protein EOP06_28450 [Proteobacteria bacterium]|nr:MAG: hypothetical protein EOP06_28450 [Pseudomonadota bacterium]
MVSELCPIDRLAQRVGRLSRFRDEAGELYLIEPHRKDKSGESNFYPAPYGSYVTGQGWQMTPVLQNSRKKLVSGDYSAADFVRLVNELYPVVPVPAPHARDNQKLLERLFVLNRFIVPTAQMNEDDEDFQGGSWRSRDVPVQKTIYFVEDDKAILDDSPHELESFANWNDWREWSQKHALTLYIYQFNDAQKNSQIESRIIPIGEDEETIWVVNRRFYNSKEGLNFDVVQDDFS